VCLSFTNMHITKRLQVQEDHDVTLDFESSVPATPTNEETERMAKAFGIGYVLGKKQRRREEDELSDTSNVSVASSIPSVVDSIFTMASGSSVSSIPGVQGAGERLVVAILDDRDIKQVCSEALFIMEEGRFERNLRRLLKDFATELRKEAGSVQQRHAANFVRFRARNTAHMICNSLTKGLRKKVEHEAEEEGSEEDDSEPSDDELENLQQLELFIKSSNAFDQFRTKLRAFVYLPKTKHEHSDSVNEKASGDIPQTNAAQEQNLILGVGRLEDIIPWNIARLQETCNPIINTILTSFRKAQPPMPLGRTRIEWQCVRQSDWSL
jgi:hypothetical protein